MTWLVLSETQGGTVSRRMSAGNRPAAKDMFLLVGSLVLELVLQAEPREDVIFLALRTNEAWPADLTIGLTSAGEVFVSLQQGHAISRASVSIPAEAGDHVLRLTYSWDAPARFGVLALEDLDEGILHQVESHTPQPLPMHLLSAISGCREANREAAYDISFIGVSDKIEPVGLVAGLARYTPIETPTGPRPIETLRPGDLVLTENSGPQKVRWIAEREVPTMGRFCPVLLRAPYLGLSRDLVVAPEQRVQMDSIEVEYLFGRDRVLAEAHDLTHGNWAQPYRGQRSLQLYHILLDRHEVICAAGCHLESLYIGQIADNPGLIPSTILAGLPRAKIPHHTTLACALLRSYEAITLQSLAH